MSTLTTYEPTVRNTATQPETVGQYVDVTVTVRHWNGQVWKTTYRTNRSLRGLWKNGSQIKGTAQASFRSPAAFRRAALANAREW